MKKISIGILSFITGISTVTAQNNVNENFQASATIENFCKIKTQDVNFGVIALPLTTQNAHSQMDILCSNATSYKVDLEYGAKYITQENAGTSGIEGISSSMAYKTKDSYENSSGTKAAGYRLYKNNKPISNGFPDTTQSDAHFEYNLNGENNRGDFHCNSTNPGKIYLRTVEAAQLLQGTSIITQWVNDIQGICSQGRINQNTFTKLFGNGSISDKGLMTGTFKGDKLAYQVSLPGNNSKPWVSGINSYEAIGTGSHQTIDVNAKIIPEASSSKFIAADNYLDTIVVNLSY